MVAHVIRLRERGQMTLPRDIRQRLGLQDGDALVITEKDGDLVISSAADVIERTAGALRHYTTGKPVLSPESIDSIASEAAGRAARHKLDTIEADGDSDA